MIADLPGTISSIWLKQNIWHTNSYNTLQKKKSTAKIKKFKNKEFEVILNGKSREKINGKVKSWRQALEAQDFRWSRRRSIRNALV